MAWWNQPVGTLTPSVTAERIAAWFAAHSYTYTLERSERAVYSGFSGTMYLFRVATARILTVQGWRATGLPTDEETVERARTVARRVADSRIMPTAYVMVSGEDLVLHTRTVVSIGAGLNDEQLASALEVSIDGTDGAVREILGGLGATVPTAGGEHDGRSGEAGPAEPAGSSSTAGRCQAGEGGDGAGLPGAAGAGAAAEAVGRSGGYQEPGGPGAG